MFFRSSLTLFREGVCQELRQRRHWPECVQDGGSGFKHGDDVRHRWDRYDDHGTQRTPDEGGRETRRQLSQGDISSREYARKLRESDFSHIPHWNAPNPFSRNYSQFVDNVNNPLIVAKYFKKASKMMKPVII